MHSPLISLRDEPRFFNCLFVGNQTKSGNAIIEDQPGTPVHVHMTNCILLNNRAGGQGGEAAQIHIGRGNVSQELTIDFSIVSGWTGGLDGEGSFDADPLFVEPGHYDDNGTPDDYLDDTWVHGDYHVLPGSPAINAGDPNSGYYAWADDLDGHPRVRCGAVDIGVYEAGAGDADCDRSVGLVDFAFFNTCLTGPPHDADPWDTEAILDDACKAFDIDNNNHVDLADWAAFTELLAG